MDILLELANYYQICRGEFQWRTLVWLSLGIVLSSLFWQIRLGRKGLTPARCEAATSNLPNQDFMDSIGLPTMKSVSYRYLLLIGCKMKKKKRKS